MLKLFEQYKNAGKISEALLVGQNVFNKNPENPEIFEAYFSYLCTLAETLPSQTERQQLAEQAGVALAFYKENADLTESVVNKIFEYQGRLETIWNEIDSVKRAHHEAALEEIRKKNTDYLKQVFVLKDKLSKASSKKEHEEILIKIHEIDLVIDKDALDTEQNAIYNSLVKECTEISSAKIREMEYNDNIAYNQKAADSFKKAYDQFRENERKYKDHTQLFILTSSTLFGFDSSRFFEETKFYYQYVYSYIFNKLDDEGKYALTRYSIECDRKVR